MGPSISVDDNLNITGVTSGVSWTFRICRLCGEPFNRGELVRWRQMGIPTGHGNRFVPHEFLGGSKVNSRHNQSARKRVS